MRRVATTPTTVLLHLETIRHLPLIFRRVVVTPFALGTGEDDDVAHSAKPFMLDLLVWRSGFGGLLDDLGNGARAHRTTTFPYRKPQALL